MIEIKRTGFFVRQSWISIFKNDNILFLCVPDGLILYSDDQIDDKRKKKRTIAQEKKQTISTKLHTYILIAEKKKNEQRKMIDLTVIESSVIQKEKLSKRKEKEKENIT